jgi:glucokinase
MSVKRILEELAARRTMRMRACARLLNSDPCVPQDKLRLLERRGVVKRWSHGALVLNPEFGVVVGVDLGASHFRLALADFCGEILTEDTQKIRPEWPPRKLIAFMVERIRSLLSSKQLGSLLSIAVGVPSAVDAETGTVVYANNLGWRNVPLGQQLRHALHVPTMLEKDTNMAALGEHWRGAARGVDDFVFVALGTGIGSGIFINGELYRGAAGWAGEIYLMNLDWERWNEDFGDTGHFERYASGRGIAEAGRKALGVAPKKSNDLAEQRDAYFVFRAFRKRDPRAREVLQKVFTMAAVGIANIVTVVDPELIVLGGGVVQGAPRLMKRIIQNVLAHFRPNPPAVVFSSLGESAQTYGAVFSALSVARRQIAAGLAPAE